MKRCNHRMQLFFLLFIYNFAASKFASDIFKQAIY